MLVLGGLLAGVSLLLVIIYLFVNVEAEYEYEVKGFETVSESYSPEMNLDSLRDLYGRNKTIPGKYELSILLALAHYPELRECEIDFVLSKEGAPLESRFSIPSLLGPGKNRKYIICLLETTGQFWDPILMDRLSLNSRVGIVAHELSHTVYYHQLSTLQILKWGMLYLLKPGFAAKHEKSTDINTVYRGYGYQLLDYAIYVRSDKALKAEYDAPGGKWIDVYYMPPNEIRDLMKELEPAYFND